MKPVKQKEVFEFISKHHRHHRPPVGWLWGHGVEEDGELIGVAVVGRPVSRMLDDGYTCEVTRLCTNGQKNVCSLLYAATRRAALAKGYKRGLTYILESETGSSLKASGWNFLGETEGGSWDRPSRNRQDKHPKCKKYKYGWGQWQH